MISDTPSPGGTTTSIPRNSILAVTVLPGKRASPWFPPSWNLRSMTAWPRCIPVEVWTISTKRWPEVAKSPICASM